MAGIDLSLLALLGEQEARERLADRDLRFAVLAPPYPALGVGTLRVLRLRGEAPTELLAGYERYERIEP